MTQPYRACPQARRSDGRRARIHSELVRDSSGLSRVIRTRTTAVIVVVAVAALMVWLPAHPSFDDNRRRLAALDLAAGRWHTVKYSLVMPMLAVLPYRIGRALGMGSFLLDHFVTIAWVPWSLWVGSRLTRLRGSRFGIGVVVLATGSMFTAFVTSFNAEALAMMIVSAGILLIVDARSRAEKITGVAIAAIGIAIIPVQVVACGVAAVMLWWRRRNSALLISCVLAAALMVADASITAGHLSLSKYGTDPGDAATFQLLPWGPIVGFGYPLLFGLVGILFSLGRGLLWYQPGFFRRAPEPDDPVAQWRWCLTVMVVVMIPIYAKWWAWYGGVTFGPRYFLLGVVPAATALCTQLQVGRSLRVWLGAVVLTLWTAWVAVVGAAFYPTKRADLMCRLEDFRYEPLCWYSGEYSSLLSPTWDRAWPNTSQILFGVLIGITVVGVIVQLTPPTRWRDVRSRAITLGHRQDAR